MRLAAAGQRVILHHAERYSSYFQTRLMLLSYQTSSYCRGDPIFTLAEADDLQIVCGEFSVESPEPEVTSDEKETVLDILKIINHPDYKPNQEAGTGGPIEGNDISVYIVDDSQFEMGNTCITLILDVENKLFSLFRLAALSRSGS